MLKIYPRCKADLNQVYITSEGYVVPCCWIGNEPAMSEYKRLHAGHLEELSVLNRDLDQLACDQSNTRDVAAIHSLSQGVQQLIRHYPNLSTQGFRRLGEQLISLAVVRG